HLDMDAFFAAIEERDRPRFAGLPIVVGADPAEGKGRGVVSTANYKAREYGIHSAMPITEAWRLSQIAKSKGQPEAIFLQPNFEKYEASSVKILGIIRNRICDAPKPPSVIPAEAGIQGSRSRIKYGMTNVPLVEPASIDEFYLDLSFVEGFQLAGELARQIKKEIKQKERLTASVGIAPNKLVAKIASDMQKPDGLTIVRDDQAEAFLEPLPIRKIPGIGPKAEEVLARKGVRLVCDMKRLTEDELREMFSKWGVDMYRKIRGIDESPVTEGYEAKSIGEQETFSVDTRDAEFIMGRIKRMAGNVIRRLRAEGFCSFRTVVLTVRFSDFETKTRSHTLGEATDSSRALEFKVIKLFLPFLDKRENPKSKLIRLIGVRVEKLVQ
ncbi:DNA polymerase IV, partial [Candidatus Wolfebacteria bacterium]|nr:DNA polymerase IV [Candidatus Wolfebacteria bacterium]